ncbi:hypothetical protein [Cedratvirus kamchatka]|uniref:Uncharacterized protein n=1 Tax=Cedratvirus kamchatka TaxID=2716914 RepID=A0A6G8MYE6_9VIRU|nr:hypothetical protein [Cedratvirus kamchatka]
MSARYLEAKKVYGEDPATLLRRMEAIYIHLSQKRNITCLELLNKWIAWDLIRSLYPIVSAYEKKIN